MTTGVPFVSPPLATSRHFPRIWIIPSLANAIEVDRDIPNTVSPPNKNFPIFCIAFSDLRLSHPAQGRAELAVPRQRDASTTTCRDSLAVRCFEQSLHRQPVQQAPHHLGTI